MMKGSHPGEKVARSPFQMGFPPQVLAFPYKVAITPSPPPKKKHLPPLFQEKKQQLLFPPEGISPPPPELQVNLT